MSSAAQTRQPTPAHRHTQVSWLAALSAFVLWGALAAGGAWVVLQGWPQLPQVGDASAMVEDDGVRVGALRRVLQEPAQKTEQQAVLVAQASARGVPGVKVLGVLSTPTGQGVALLQVGQEPAKPYLPGAEVPGLGVVQAVTAQAIRIGASLSGPTTQTLVPPQAD